MKKLVKYITLSCALLCSTKAMADAKWYTNGFGGVNILNNNSILPEDAKIETGFIAGLSGGRQIGNHFKLEGELAYRENKIAYYTGAHRQGNAMINGSFDLFPQHFATPYVGIGSGLFCATYELQAIHFGLSTQEMLGLHTSRFQNTELGVEYRFTHDLLFENQNQSISLNCAFKF